MADGQPVAFSGKKTPRPASPGPRQFALLAPGETVQATVNLNGSYRLPSGTHAYSVTYAAPNVYPARLQTMTLTSNEAGLTLTR
jgi:hypothetical protein